MGDGVATNSLQHDLVVNEEGKLLGKDSEKRGYL